MDTPEQEPEAPPEPEAPTTTDEPASSDEPSDGRASVPRWAIGFFVLLAVVIVAQAASLWLLVDRTDQLTADLAAANADAQRVAIRLDGLESDIGALGDEVTALGQADVSVVGGAAGTTTGLPVYPTSGPDPAVGLTIPEITGADHYTGEEFTLGVGDKATITMVWAHWCPHCQREVPMLADVVASGALEPYDAVQVQSVTTFIDDSRGNPLLPYLEAVGLGVPVIVDEDGSIAAQLGMQSVPAWIVTDADGRVLGRFTGAIGEEAFLSVVEEVQRVATEGGA